MMPPAPLSAAAPDAPTGFRHFHDQLETLKERLLMMSDRLNKDWRVIVDQNGRSVRVIWQPKC